MASRGHASTDDLREVLERTARLAESEAGSMSVEGSDPSAIRRVGDRLFRAAWWARWQVLLRVPVNLEARRAAYGERKRRERELGPRAYATWVAEYDTLDDADFDGMRKLDAGLEHRPLISVVMVVHDPSVPHLEAALRSVYDQVYDAWELCLADDSSDDTVRRTIEQHAAREGRVRVVRRDAPGGASAAANAALDVARGELVAFLGQEDLLRPHSLLLVASVFSRSPQLAYAYSDEDVIDESGRRVAHRFKPDWNPELLRSQHVVGHLTAMRTELARTVGGFRSEYDGSEHWDLALRVGQHVGPTEIAHIPHLLYHRRAVKRSGAADVTRTGAAAVRDHLRRAGVAATVVEAGEAAQNVRYEIVGEAPMVSIVVPTTMRDGLFESLVESLAITGWERLEIVRVVPPGAIRASASVSPMLLPGWRLVDVAFEEDVFNFARAVNRGCEQASGSLFLIANDDLEILHRDWLELMVGQATQPRVGAVGPLLLYPDGRVQHAGVLLGSGGAAGHLYYGASILDRGYMSRLRLNQDLSCVTGACMLVRAEAFHELGGYDESFTVAFNDVDFCVRLRRAGWRIVFTPEVMLTHRESSSFGSHYAERRDDWKREYDEMRRRLGEEQDPFHNPNLRLDSSRPGALAFPPRVAYPWLGAE